jgi:hypothetical protein
MRAFLMASARAPRKNERARRRIRAALLKYIYVAGTAATTASLTASTVNVDFSKSTVIAPLVAAHQFSV